MPFLASILSSCSVEGKVCFEVRRRPGSRNGSLTIFCGEVEDVVGALTPVGSGVAQVFHDLLVELRLLLVAEVEEGEEEEGQEESWEVESGVGRVKETTLTWMTCG